VGRAARGLLRFVERHPTIAAVATVVVIVWGLAVEPILALIAFAVLLAGSFVGAMAMGVRRRRRTRPLDWRPRDISSDGLAVDGESLRRAMRALRLPVHPIVGRYLDRTLIRSTVLVAMPGPVPVDPDRWLDWQRRTGAPVEIGTARARDGSLVSAAWTGPDIVPRSGPMKPDWTLPMPFHDLVHATLDAGATSLLLDPPRRWGLELGERSLAWHAGVGRRDPSDVQGNAQEPGAEASGGAEPSDDADAEGPSAPTS